MKPLKKVAASVAWKIHSGGQLAASKVRLRWPKLARKIEKKSRFLFDYTRDRKWHI